MGLKGSKSMFIFFSLPSSVMTVPVYTTRPLGGTCRKRQDKRNFWVVRGAKEEGHHSAGENHQAIGRHLPGELDVGRTD